MGYYQFIALGNPCIILPERRETPMAVDTVSMGKTNNRAVRFITRRVLTTHINLMLPLNLK